jgi:tripartite ATP-independent transporter DctM subunit
MERMPTGLKPGKLLAAAGTVIRLLTEISAGVLVAAEILILLFGVVSRYVFHSSITWSDELASILFLWLAMLGSVVALQRGEHVRMTTIIGCMRPSILAFIDALAISGALAFLIIILGPSFDFANSEVSIVTPALEISNAWRAAALPVGIVLMIFVSLLRLIETAKSFHVIGAVAFTLCVMGILFAVAPFLRLLGNINLLIFFVGILGTLVLIGIPIAFSFGLATVGYLRLTTSIPLHVVVGRMYEGMSHLILLAVPLFIFLGMLIGATGMARVMVNFLGSLLGHVRGGLSYVLVGAMYLVSGISGSKAADMAAVAPVLVPEMRKNGAKPGELLAILCATGAQTETVPPSLVLIAVASVTGVSISALFSAGLLPSLVCGLILCLVIWLRSRGDDHSDVQRSSASEIGRNFLMAAPALALPIVIRTAVVEGVATATEVSTIGIVYSLMVGLVIYREFAWRRAGIALVDTASLSGVILLIIGAATGMAWSLTQAGLSEDLARAMSGIPGGTIGFLCASIVAFIVLGSVLEGIPAIVVFGPLLFPIARQTGVDEVHYAIVVIIAMGIGLFLPPFGMGYYTAAAISQIHPNEGVRPIIPYMVAILIALIIIAVFPRISTGLL